MTDVAFLLSILSDGKAHSTNEILRRSFDERGHGLMVHSRAADLRARGHQIACEHVPGKKRGEAYVYKLLLPQGSLTPSCEPISREAPPSQSDQGAELVGGASTLFEMPVRPAWS